MNPAIETTNLSKAYGTILAVDSLSLRVEHGEIYGFLGRNGAGKTTTIRALLGMIQPSAGTVNLLGDRVGPHGRGPWRRVGHLVERPAAYPELTVRENLEVARRLQGIADERATTRAIDRLGLASVADRRARVLSTGNLQRLALSRALLHDPDLLVLDEPANGLDPAGVVEIRELLERLARERGVTVFMSSHILSEVDRLATRIGIIHKGRLVKELSSGQREELRARSLELMTHDNRSALGALHQAGYEATERNGTIVSDDPRAVDAPDRIATLLVSAGNAPTRLLVRQEDLEDYFLKLTRDTQ